MGHVKLVERGINNSKLTDKQRKFVAEYLVDFNGTRAVVAAGYSSKGASVRATKLLKHRLVSKAIGRVQLEDLARLELSREEVLQQLYYCAARNAKQLCSKDGILVMNHQVVDGEVRGSTIHDLPDAITCTIDGIKQRVRRWTSEVGIEYEEVETELKLTSKLGAVDLAMKHKGLFAPVKAKVEHGLDWDTLYSQDGQVLNADDGEIQRQAITDDQSRSDGGRG